MDRHQKFLLLVDMMGRPMKAEIAHVIENAIGLVDMLGYEAICKVDCPGQVPFSAGYALALLTYSYCRSIRLGRVIEHSM